MYAYDYYFWKHTEKAGNSYCLRRIFEWIREYRRKNKFSPGVLLSFECCTICMHYLFEKLVDFKILSFFPSECVIDIITIVRDKLGNKTDRFFCAPEVDLALE